MKTYSISQFKNDEFTAKMDKFTKRANRLGLSFGYTLESTSESSFKDENKNQVFYTVYNYSVYGQSPVINGYSFLAKLESFEGVNLIHSHNTDFNFDVYRDSALICEHCNVKRDRNFYFLVMNETTKEVKMLGGNCLAQYIAQPNAEQIAEFYNDVLGIEDSTGESEYKEKLHSYKISYSLIEYLSLTVAIVEKHGYTSVKNENFENHIISTKTRVNTSFFYNGKDKVIATDENKQQAQHIINTVKDSLTSKAELTNYEHTILTLVESGRMNFNHCGYAVSIVPLYNRIMEVKYTKETIKQSEYIGVVGEKFTNIHATVIKESQYDSAYGTSYIFTFKDNNDNILVWFSSNNVCDLNDKVILTKGTIKEHKEYNNTKQTIITRCKIEIIKQ